jgi:protein-S-isoprenylcysteine O-methyltransferase Ste14
MSLIPTFELGIWNAWIFILPIVILSIFGVKILGSRVTDEYSSLTKKEKRIFSLYMIMIVTSYSYSVFLPFQLGTAWFHIGLLIFLLGIIIGIMAIINFAATPTNEPVTRGVYRISRNPMYVSEILLYFSISIACVSWIFLLIAIIAGIYSHDRIAVEESFCLSKYGNTYREYMNKTPRWIGIPK